jgi:hypothetical protein
MSIDTPICVYNGKMPTNNIINQGLNIFLVSTFCEIVKNCPYILKMVKKIHKFFSYQEWSIPAVFQRNAYL